MSTNLERFKASDCWDARYELPTCPKLSNPHLYIALADKLCGGGVWGKKGDDQTQDQLKYVLFMRDCHRADYLWRWPLKGGGKTSHDELIGASYLNPYMARDAVKQISKKWGFYDNESPDKPALKTWFYRFPWAIAYLRRRAQHAECGWFPLYPWHRIGFALYLIGQALSHRDDVHAGQDGKLMTWLMLPEMEGLWGIRLAARFWHWRMRNVGPMWCFETYLVEYPVFKETAPDRFI